MLTKAAPYRGTESSPWPLTLLTPSFQASFSPRHTQSSNFCISCLCSWVVVSSVLTHYLLVMLSITWLCLHLKGSLTQGPDWSIIVWNLLDNGNWPEECTCDLGRANCCPSTGRYTETGRKHLPPPGISELPATVLPPPGDNQGQQRNNGAVPVGLNPWSHPNRCPDFYSSFFNH